MPGHFSYRRTIAGWLHHGYPACVVQAGARCPALSARRPSASPMQALPIGRLQGQNIGPCQWHFRTVGADQMPPEPVLRDVQTIETRDAVIDWDRKVLATDELGAPIKVW